MAVSNIQLQVRQGLKSERSWWWLSRAMGFFDERWLRMRMEELNADELDESSESPDEEPGPPPEGLAIANKQTRVPIDVAWFERLVRHTLNAEGVECQNLSLAFVGDGMIHSLNRKYLAHDCPTDVITFPYSEPGEPIAGEIVVSTDFALASAGDWGWPVEHELALYVIHGILHLNGYDDHNEEDANRMSARQETLLHSFLREAPGTMPSTRRDESQSP